MLRYHYKRQFRKILILFVPVIFFCPGVFAQSEFKGILLNNADSSTVLYATVHVAETDTKTITNEHGEFVFLLPDDLKQVTFTVTAIGCKTKVTYKRTFSNPEKVYVYLIPGTLEEVTVVGKSAKDIVVKAVAAIPNNYMDETYYSFSLYRQYQKVNDVFMNMVEAQPVVWFKLSSGRDKITAKETYAVADLRRTHFVLNPDNMYASNLSYHMKENPIYHLPGSSLDPDRFKDYKFSFDTADLPDSYIINYTCKAYSTEGHGIENYGKYDFHGESWETGKLVIDKTTYAIKKIHRNSYRYPEYGYPKNNNILQPDGKYFVEFIIGELIADYVFFDGKWYLKRLVHQYTNDFFSMGKNTKNDYLITDFFEWQAETISKTLNKEFNGRFYPNMENGKYDYDSTSWTNVSQPFYFYPKDVIYKDLLQFGPLQRQYERESYKR